MHKTANEIGVKTPEYLHLSDGKRIHYGGNQIWYKSLWQRKAGCGPTVAATVCAYLAKSRPECASLCEHNSSTKEGFLLLMQDLWRYVTPGMGGSSVEIFTDGITRYARSKGVELVCDVLDIPKQKELRPSAANVLEFFRKAFEADLPIAFQNYSNGALTNLEAWHWVTLLSFKQDTFFAQMYDQSIRDFIDIPLYLSTATNAGKFVVTRPNLQV
ncbi:hypothetical protein LJC42_03845 [Eubacteriales bacterium OttesenSCG-928-K08]|nr:hypothetical protein [Eubacteriales bacterium OttesenSCG-928-K08]